MNPGDLIGDYTIVSMIGEGGMSSVYLAEHTTHRTPVVVKELKHQHLFNQQVVDRFVRGARILKDLRHPHLARVFDYLERDGRHFVVEEYLPGGSLADLLARSGPPPSEEALGWCRGVLQAINYAHEHGIVHRDLKPSNLMLDADRQVKVIDFGIARAFGEARLTRTTDGMIGTLQYMSREQILTPNEVDHQTDVYSAGIVLYELLTGHVPFDGPNEFAIQEQIARHAPPPMRKFKPDIDPAVEKIVFKAIEKDPTRRYGGCSEFAVAVDGYLKGERPAAWTTSVRVSVERFTSRFPRPLGSRRAVAALLVLMVLGTALPVVSGLIGDVMGRGETPAMSLVADVDPPTVSAVGTVATYRYRVENTGNVGLEGVKVVDDKSREATFTTGDTNANATLDPGETWVFESKATIDQTHFDGEGPLVGGAVATSNRIKSERSSVSVTIERQPAIEIAALVDGAERVQLRDPRSVVYTYRVTNSGNVSLTGVGVTDWHESKPLLAAGDSNRNEVLDVGETWEYRSTVGITGQQVEARTPIVSRAVAVSNRATSAPDSAMVAFAAQQPPRILPPRPGVPSVPAQPPTATGPSSPTVVGPSLPPPAGAPSTSPAGGAPSPPPVALPPSTTVAPPSPPPVVQPQPPVVQATYQGPRSGVLRCRPGTQVVQNGQVVLSGLPPGRIGLDYDTDEWSAAIRPDDDNTQRVILTNKRPGTRRECTVKWQLLE
jgi:tRNA A-37 threonylcarbamoyl transferase component Bud32